MTRAFITGITGQDGGYLAEQLLGEGVEVHALAQDTDPAAVPDGVHVHRGDLLETDAVQDLLLEVDPSEVYNLAALSSVAQSWEEPVLSARVNGLAAVACHTDGTETLVRQEFGELLPPAAERDMPMLLKQAIKKMLADPDRLRAAGRQAKAFAEANRFSDTAARIADLLMAEPLPAGRS